MRLLRFYDAPEDRGFREHGSGVVDEKSPKFANGRTCALGMGALKQGAGGRSHILPSVMPVTA